MMVGRLLSYWEGSFSGAMLNFRRVDVSRIRLKSLMNLFVGLFIVRFLVMDVFCLFSREKDSAVYLSWIDDGKKLDNFHPLFA